MNTTVSPVKISVAAPCPARWEDMGGSERVRFCSHCQKNVYNISALTSAEATALLNSGNGNLCARIYRRVDGTVITQDCPVGLARLSRRFRIVVSTAAAILLLAVVNLRAFMSDPDNSAAAGARRGHLTFGVEDMLSKLATWSPLFPQPVMGKIRATPLPRPAPSGGVVSSNAPALVPAKK